MNMRLFLPSNYLVLCLLPDLFFGFSIILAYKVDCVRAYVLSRFSLVPLEPARLLCPWDSPGRNTGVGCHFLLQLSRGLGVEMSW